MAPLPSSGDFMENPMSDALSATSFELDDTQDETREKPAWAAVVSLTFGVFGLVVDEDRSAL